MGLAGRKVKQRIGPDPRNLTWADDVSKFGANYLAKFGWDSSKGLGVEGQGRTSHIKVSQKLDMLGIGAAQYKDPDGIAWTQNKDFESLLRRLNDNVPATPIVTGDTGNGEDGIESDVDMEKDERKTESREDRKKRKREKKEKKGKNKRKRDGGGDEEVEQQKPKKKAKSEEVVEEKSLKVDKLEEPKRVIPRHRAHRARAIAAKNISSKSAIHISEILGIASSSATPAAVATPSGTLTPLDQDVAGLEKLTTSTKSVSDYFKERLLAKTSGKSSLIIPTEKDDSNDNSEGPPRAGLGSSLTREEDFDDAPHGGLGSTRTATTFNSTSSSFQNGLSKFASMFTSATVTTREEITVGVCTDVGATQMREKKKMRKEEQTKKNHSAESESDVKAVDVQVAKKKAKDERKREKAAKKEKKKQGTAA
ncbi:hypothetical protein J3R30DRAFT_3565569 [Lentinula aciculospora]|uniref:G-patch domain-containing protein n=1 Tax=Lentinula aciculospora TaxID=153920 RepID=A0A9W8ZVX2_9AGAR|nr:hypothetical protein J3R30DRAFT_3565569 [Lentinula aciculospora]